MILAGLGARRHRQRSHYRDPGVRLLLFPAQSRDRLLERERVGGRPGGQDVVVDTAPGAADRFLAIRALTLLGAMVQFGWEKALGTDIELDWWIDNAMTGVEFL